MKFALKTPYNAGAVAAIKSLPYGDRKWDQAKKAWMVDASRIHDIAHLIRPFFPNISDDLINGERYQEAREESGHKQVTLAASKAKDSNLKVPAPAGLDYLPYQKAGIEFALARTNTLIGDAMGLGKTIQVIGVLNALINESGNVPRTLIVCPASLKLNWKRELCKWLVSPIAIDIVNGKMDANATISIINFDILKKHKATIQAVEWDILVVDECHYLKNPKAQRTAMVLGRKEIPAITASQKIFLTGTPMVNRPVELWPIVHALDPDTFRNWKYFVMRYCAGEMTGWGWDVSGASNLGELQEKLRSTIMIRRLKEDVLTELPAKRRQIIELPANGSAAIVAKERKAWSQYESRLDDLRVKVELAKAGGSEVEYEEAVAALSYEEQLAFSEMSKIRHETAVAKVPAVVEHVRDALEASGKVVLFAHHRDVISAIAAEFGDACVTLTGDTPMIKRQEAVDRFQADASCTLFIGNIQAAGVGITLTAASHVVFAELDWVPGNISQAEDRCHRIGQVNSVLVQHLVLDGSIDAEMAKRIVAKQAVIDEALDNEFEPSAGFSLQAAQDRAEKDAESQKTAATESTSRKAIQEQAATFTPDMIDAVQQALLAVAVVCDGAARKDHTGFNKIDARIGRELVMRGSLTPAQAALGRKIVGKYRRQFGADLMARMFPESNQ